MASVEVDAADTVGAAAHRIARPSCGCRPLACRRVTTLVPIRTTPLTVGPWRADDARLPRGVLLAVGGVGRAPPARGERIGGVGLLDDRAGAEVRVPDRREHERVRLGAVADRPAVIDQVGDAAGEAGRGRAGGGQHAGGGAEGRAGGAEADDAAAAGQERVQRRAVGRVQVGVVQRRRRRRARRRRTSASWPGWSRSRPSSRTRARRACPGARSRRRRRPPPCPACAPLHDAGGALKVTPCSSRLRRRERAGAGRHEDRAVGQALDLDALREQRVQRRAGPARPADRAAGRCSAPGRRRPTRPRRRARSRRRAARPTACRRSRPRSDAWLQPPGPAYRSSTRSVRSMPGSSSELTMPRLGWCMLIT